MKRLVVLGMLGAAGVLGACGSGAQGPTGAQGPAGMNGTDGTNGEAGPPGSGAPATPSVSGITPAQSFLSRTTELTISGYGTSWSSSTTVDFGGTDIVVNKITGREPDGARREHQHLEDRHDGPARRHGEGRRHDRDLQGRLPGPGSAGAHVPGQPRPGRQRHRQPEGARRRLAPRQHDGPEHRGLHEHRGDRSHRRHRHGPFRHRLRRAGRAHHRRGRACGCGRVRSGERAGRRDHERRTSRRPRRSRSQPSLPRR